MMRNHKSTYILHRRPKTRPSSYISAVLAILIFLSQKVPQPIFALRPTTSASRIRNLLSEFDRTSLNPDRRAIAIPGVHDALSAKIFSECGASALFLSGFGVSASRLGAPDAGVLTLSEMEDVARGVVSAASPTPVIADGDTGHGGPSNIRRCVRGLAAAGCAGVTIEDQKFPKRCTFAAGGGVKVVSREMALKRVKAAIAAREEAREIDGNDIIVVARTDCRAAMGYSEVVERCLLFEDAGADVVYAESLKDRNEYVDLRSRLGDSTAMMIAQLQVQGTEGDSYEECQVLYDAQEVGKMGYALALYGVTALQAVISTLQGTAHEFVLGAGIIHTDSKLTLSSFDNVKKTVGFPELYNFEENYN